jgi:HEAT repeat protein
MVVATGLVPFSIWAAKEPVLTSDVLLRDTEQLLRLAKPDLEKMAHKLSLDQKLILKKIAFNSESDLQVRWRSLVLAARLLGGEMRSDIALAAKSNEWFMRSAAMMAASEISSEEAAMLARKMVYDKALVVRSAAVDILGATGEATDRSLLWNIIRDPINVRKGQSLWIRSQALQLLAKNPQKKEMANFIALLKDNDLELQAISIQALEKASDFQFGSTQESIEEHRKRWLNWWEMSGKTKSL